MFLTLTTSRELCTASLTFFLFSVLLESFYQYRCTEFGSIAAVLYVKFQKRNYDISRDLSMTWVSPENPILQQTPEGGPEQGKSCKNLVVPVSPRKQTKCSILSFLLMLKVEIIKGHNHYYNNWFMLLNGASHQWRQLGKWNIYSRGIYDLLLYEWLPHVLSW